MYLKIHFIPPKNVHDANSKILCTNNEEFSVKSKKVCECRLTEINYFKNTYVYYGNVDLLIYNRNQDIIEPIKSNIFFSKYRLGNIITV